MSKQDELLPEPLHQRWEHCCPRDVDKETYVILFDDRDKPPVYIHDELEAIEFFSQAETNWNCSLFALMKRNHQASNRTQVSNEAGSNEQNTISHTPQADEVKRLEEAIRRHKIFTDKFDCACAEDLTLYAALSHKEEAE